MGVRTFAIYSFSNFQLYNTLLLTAVITLHIRSPELIHLRAESLYYLISPFFLESQPLLTTTYFLLLWVQLFFHYTYKWDYVIFFMISNVEHLSMCLMALCRLPLQKPLFRSSAHFSIRLFGFFWYWVLWVFNIFWILTPYQTYQLQMTSHTL